MARNSKSRKLRNRKMTGGGLFCGNFLFTKPCDTPATIVQNEHTTQNQVQSGEQQGQGQFPTGQGQVLAEPRQAPLGQGRAPAEPYGPSSMGGKFRGGKSNRRNKSKKSRRTRRR